MPLPLTAKERTTLATVLTLLLLGLLGMVVLHDEPAPPPSSAEKQAGETRRP